MNLKKQLLKKQIQKLRGTQVLSRSKTKPVGLVFDGISAEEIIDFVNRFKQSGFKEVDLKVLLCDPEEALPRGVETEVLKMENIGFNGKIKEELRVDFLEYEYEFLIGYFSDKSLIGALIFASSRAKFKIGKAPDVFQLFDVEITTGESKVFLRESLKYLEILKVKN